MNLSVVIPVYNGERTLAPLVERLGRVLPGVAAAYEVVLVCDGSPDRSWEAIEGLAARHSWVRGIQMMRNYGQHNALLCGVRAARYEAIVTMDDDLQNPPEEIPALVRKLEEGHDVVFGVPKQMSQTWWRNVASVLSKRVVALVMGTRGVSDITSYRIFRTHLRQAFASYQGPDLLLDVLLTWGTEKFSAIPVEEMPRPVGRSNYSLVKLVRMALILITSYTTVPLRLASVLGFFFTLVGVILMLYVVVTYFLLGSEPGFSFLACAIVIFSGVQLFALGIMGEYLARVFDRTHGRPTYQVLKTVGDPR